LHKMLKMRGYDDEASTQMAKTFAKKQMEANLFVPPDDNLVIDIKDDPYFETEQYWIVEQHEPFVREDGVKVIKNTYSSPVIRLKTGEAHFSLNPLFHCPFPKGDYQILSHTYRMVRQSADETVSLAEVYPHHWLIGGDSPLDECQRDFFWGGGAEFHDMKYEVADGYAFKRIGSQGWCGGNFHFIRQKI